MYNLQATDIVFFNYDKACERAERRLRGALKAFQEDCKNLRDGGPLGKEWWKANSSEVNSRVRRIEYLLFVFRRMQNTSFGVFSRNTSFTERLKYPPKVPNRLILASQLCGYVGKHAHLQIDNWWLECCMISVWNHAVNMFLRAKDEALKIQEEVLSYKASIYSRGGLGRSRAKVSSPGVKVNKIKGEML